MTGTAIGRAEVDEPDVIVVGGGLAGIAAALECADRGRRVVLLEARPKLGGLTHSFRRAQQWVDNGQHVFLRCCTAYRGFLDRLGVADQVHLQDRLRIPVRSPRHPKGWTLVRTDAPAPLHLGHSLMRYGALSWLDRLKAPEAMLALRRVNRNDPATDAQNFGDWLARHRQSARAVDTLWDLITVPTLNAGARDSSLALAATVFQLGLLDDPAASDIGWAAVPLQQLHGDAAARALAAAGVDVRLGTKADRLEPNDGGWTVGLRDGAVLSAPAVVLAAPPDVADRLVDVTAWGLPAGWVERLGTAPIVNVHVHLDRQVCDEPFVATVDSPVQWVFDRTASAGVDRGQYLAVSLSAADEWIDVPAARVVQIVLDGLRKVFPTAAEAAVLDAFVTRERHATFRPSAGSAQWRPDPVTAESIRRAPGLALAGAWTATGWPATMEGAIRSGLAAADALVAGTAVPRTGERAPAA